MSAASVAASARTVHSATRHGRNPLSVLDPARGPLRSRKQASAGCWRRVHETPRRTAQLWQPDGARHHTREGGRLLRDAPIRSALDRAAPARGGDLDGGHGQQEARLLRARSGVDGGSLRLQSGRRDSRLRRAAPRDAASRSRRDPAASRAAARAARGLGPRPPIRTRRGAAHPPARRRAAGRGHLARARRGGARGPVCGFRSSAAVRAGERRPGRGERGPADLPPRDRRRGLGPSRGARDPRAVLPPRQRLGS